MSVEIKLAYQDLEKIKELFREYTETLNKVSRLMMQSAYFDLIIQYCVITNNHAVNHWGYGNVSYTYCRGR